MSQVERMIICRRCRESIQVEGGACPHCGTSIRSNRMPIVSIVIGAIIVLFSALSFRELLFFFVIGVALIGIGGYLIWDRRNRINEANTAEIESGPGEDTDAI